VLKDKNKEKHKEDKQKESEKQNEKEQREQESKNIIEKEMERLKDIKLRQLNSNRENNSNQLASLLNQGNQGSQGNKGSNEKVEKVIEIKFQKEGKSNDNFSNYNDISKPEKESPFRKPIIYSERSDVYVDKKIDKVGVKTKYPGSSGAPKFNLGFNRKKPNYDNNKKNAEAFLINFPKNEKKIIKTKPKIIASKDKNESGK